VMVMAPSSFSLHRTIVCRALVSASTTSTTTTTTTIRSRYIKARDTRSGLWFNSGGRDSSSRVSLLHGSSSRRRIDAPPVLATSEREAEITSVEDDPRRWLLLLSPMSSGWSLWLLSFGFLQLYEATGHAHVLGF